MSAFLGPIHYWLFNKIKLQDDLVYNILSHFPDKEQLLLDELREKYGELPQGELADIIDGGNIHGWLQQNVTLVENRLAYVVSHLLNDNVDKETLLNSVYDFGANNKIADSIDATDAYQTLQNILLDGMPCDNVNALVESDSNLIHWKRVDNIHAQYWLNQNADPSDFDEVRNAWIKGMLSDSNITFLSEAEDFYLKAE